MGNSAMPADLRDFLAAIRSAIDIPNPATVGDTEAYHQVLANRVMHTVTALWGVLDHNDDPGWSADYLRARLAEHPTNGYRTWGGETR